MGLTHEEGDCASMCTQLSIVQAVKGEHEYYDKVVMLHQRDGPNLLSHRVLKWARASVQINLIRVVGRFMVPSGNYVLLSFTCQAFAICAPSMFDPMRRVALPLLRYCGHCQVTHVP